MRIRILIGLAIVACISVESGSAQDRMNAPSDPLARRTDPRKMDAYGSGSNTVLDVYQQLISPVRGERRCPMHPSCSQYAKHAFATLPWHVAFPRVFERVLRCGRELQYYPTIVVDGELRWSDPLETEQEDFDDASENGRVSVSRPSAADDGGPGSGIRR